MTHADCKHFNPDPIGRAGLGSCGIKKDLGPACMPYWHKGQWEWHYQEKLCWPAGEACDQFEEKP